MPYIFYEGQAYRSTRDEKKKQSDCLVRKQEVHVVIVDIVWVARRDQVPDVKSADGQIMIKTYRMRGEEEQARRTARVNEREEQHKLQHHGCTDNGYRSFVIAYAVK